MDVMLSIVGADAGWTEFPVAAAGVTGALAGLLIVTISVNVRQILASRALVYSAGSTVASLVLAVIVSLLMLIPQPPLALGVEILLATAPPAILQARSIMLDQSARSRGEGFTARVVTVTAVFAVLQYAPILVAIVLLLIASNAGMYFLAAAVILIVIAAMMSAWVLLIEVLR